jgi:hypothetical protein
MNAVLEDVLQSVGPPELYEKTLLGRKPVIGATYCPNFVYDVIDRNTAEMKNIY